MRLEDIQAGQMVYARDGSWSGHITDVFYNGDVPDVAVIRLQGVSLNPWVTLPLPEHVDLLTTRSGLH